MSSTTKQMYEIQKKYEETFGKKGIHAKAVKDLRSTEFLLPKIEQTVAYLEEWLETDHWEAKNKRLAQFDELYLEELVYDLLAIICLECTKPMPLVSVASMAAKYLNMNNKLESIQTCAEILAILAINDLCDEVRNKENTRYIVSVVELDISVIKYKFNAMYLPPMIIKPRTVRHNRDSGYITQKGESLILGYYENHHEEEISLDVLNILNANEYELDKDVISNRTDHFGKKELTDEEYKKLSHEQRLVYDLNEEEWEKYNHESYQIMTLMLYHNNSFYLQNRVDKRGRIYASGYHLSTQGKSYKKACINLKKKEICNGIKDWI